MSSQFSAISSCIWKAMRRFFFILSKKNTIDGSGPSEIDAAILFFFQQKNNFVSSKNDARGPSNY